MWEFIPYRKLSYILEVLIEYDVFFTIFRGKSVEMGVKGIEMS